MVIDKQPRLKLTMWVIALQTDTENEQKHGRNKQYMHECYQCTASSVAKHGVEDAL